LIFDVYMSIIHTPIVPLYYLDIYHQLLLPPAFNYHVH